MKRFTGKVALITGGSSGIGYATAKELISEGASVIITGRNKKSIDTMAKELGATGFVTDQSDLLALDELAAKVKSQFGKIDILFINAGTWVPMPWESITDEYYESFMGINFKGVFFTLQKLSPLLQKGSSVTMMSALSAYTGADGSMAIYAASRAAINSLTRTLAYELGGRGIRLNSVCPGPIDTPIYFKAGIPREVMTPLMDNLKQRIPLKRFGSVDDVAKLVVFLSSDDASFITGSEYIMDGGLSRAPLI